MKERLILETLSDIGVEAHSVIFLLELAADITIYDFRETQQTFTSRIL